MSLMPTIMMASSSLPTSSLPSSDSLTISCGECRMQGTSSCEECVVTFICDREPDDAIIIDADEARAVQLLGRSGLLPPLRHERRTTCA